MSIEKRDIKTEISTVKSELVKHENRIKEYDTKIAECKRQIQTIYSSLKETSKRGKIMTTLNQLNSQLKEKDHAKKELKERLGVIQGDIAVIKDEISIINGGSEIMSLETINSKIENLNKKFLSDNMSDSESKRCYDEIIKLENRREKYGMSEMNTKKLQNKTKIYQDMVKELKNINNTIFDTRITIKNTELELKKLTASKTEKIPEVEKLDEQIASLKTLKKNEISNRSAKRDQLHNLIIESKEIKRKILIAKELEAEKGKIRDKIKEELKKINLEEQRLNDFSDKVFENLRFNVNKAKKLNDFKFSADLVSKLFKYKISIPNDQKSADKTLEEIDQKQRETAGRYRKVYDEVNKNISSVRAVISEYEKELTELPVSHLKTSSETKSSE
ncbi:hypothetical protein HERIO_1488 [Hepatospora eriocheir]|uniref:Uncharacterized protein n=1 Tax=Hepatospora eriocheir TaxID=1081669 RepID=A0A1X0QA87_9MICR|nr:hypothetical protein HERIO_1488 [Hepatospora eriocheir]